MTWPLEDAGALPEADMTAHYAMFTIGGLRPGATVLIHAVGPGVATAALQIDRAAALTIGTSRTADKLEKARALASTTPSWSARTSRSSPTK
jgi:NADPH:quinone reductase-like Zn-dependent oxidoreductase